MVNDNSQEIEKSTPVKEQPISSGQNGTENNFFLEHRTALNLENNENRNQALRIAIKSGVFVEHQNIPNLSEIVNEYSTELIFRGHLKFKIQPYVSKSTNFEKVFLEDSNGDKIDSTNMNVSLMEIFKLSEGLCYIKHYGREEANKKLPTLSKMKFNKITNDCIDAFFADDDVTTIKNLFSLLDGLPFDAHRKGQGLFLPVIKTDRNIGIFQDNMRTNLNLDNLDTPLRQVFVGKRGKVRAVPGITNARSTICFCGTISPSMVGAGPRLDTVDLIVAGKSRTWLVIPSAYYELAIKKVLQELKRIGLDDDDELLTTPPDCLFQHGNLLLTPTFLKKHKIDYRMTRQEDGDIIVTGAKTISSYVSSGLVVAKAVSAVHSDFFVRHDYGFNQCHCLNRGQPAHVTSSIMSCANSSSEEDKDKMVVDEPRNEEILDVVSREAYEWLVNASAELYHKRSLVGFPTYKEIKRRKRKQDLCSVVQLASNNFNSKKQDKSTAQGYANYPELPNKEKMSYDKSSARQPIQDKAMCGKQIAKATERNDVQQLVGWLVEQVTDTDEQRKSRQIVEDNETRKEVVAEPNKSSKDIIGKRKFNPQKGQQNIFPAYSKEIETQVQVVVESMIRIIESNEEQNLKITNVHPSFGGASPRCSDTTVLTPVNDEDHEASAMNHSEENRHTQDIFNEILDDVILPLSHSLQAPPLPNKNCEESDEQRTEVYKHSAREFETINIYSDEDEDLQKNYDHGSLGEKIHVEKFLCYPTLLKALKRFKDNVS